MMEALSEYATTVCWGETASVLRIMPNSDLSCSTPSMVNLALKILWRQCSELACANIISSTSVGLRLRSLKALTRYSISSSARARPHCLFAVSSAARPPPSTSTNSMGWACRVENSCSASARVAKTDSVMRSCSKAAICAVCACDSSGLPPSRQDFTSTRYSVMRSTRNTLRPQLRAMSVALEAQGEMVPRRGVTTRATPSLPPTYGSPYVNKAARR